jgi:hypothetical protein
MRTQMRLDAGDLGGEGGRRGKGRSVERVYDAREILRHLIPGTDTSFDPSTFVLLPEGREAIRKRDEGLCLRFPVGQGPGGSSVQ